MTGKSAEIQIQFIRHSASSSRNAAKQLWALTGYLIQKEAAFVFPLGRNIGRVITLPSLPRLASGDMAATLALACSIMLIFKSLKQKSYREIKHQQIPCQFN